MCVCVAAKNVRRRQKMLCECEFESRSDAAAEGGVLVAREMKFDAKVREWSVTIEEEG